MSTSTVPDLSAFADCAEALEFLVNKTIRHVLGGALLEILVMTILYGIILGQAYIYFEHSAMGDSKTMRTFCASLLVVETLHTLLSWYIAYTYLISDAADLQSVAEVSWTVGACFTCGMIIVAMVQVVYIRRVMLLTGRLVVPILLGLILLVRAFAYLASIGLLYKFADWTRYRDQMTTQLSVDSSLALTVFGDVMICITQVIHLYQSRTGFKKTDSALTLLIAYTLRSGLLSVMVSVAAILTFTLSKDTLDWTGLMLVSSKLYANSMFSSLNARRMVRHTLRSGPADQTDISTNQDIFEEMDEGRDRAIRVRTSSSQVYFIDELAPLFSPKMG
ncbi:hypothetical protein C8Q75DRAFT_48851 [Abortiporus biennis]|nr:hypothetical protein C8Q75DRAFT_48851 [Abortiporus biennis]